MFSKALDEGKEIRVIFFDISKAFDRAYMPTLERLKAVEGLGCATHTPPPPPPPRTKFPSKANKRAARQVDEIKTFDEYFKYYFKSFWWKFYKKKKGREGPFLFF